MIASEAANSPASNWINLFIYFTIRHKLARLCESSRLVRGFVLPSAGPEVGALVRRARARAALGFSSARETILAITFLAFHHLWLILATSITFGPVLSYNPIVPTYFMRPAEPTTPILAQTVRKVHISARFGGNECALLCGTSTPNWQGDVRDTS